MKNLMTCFLITSSLYSLDAFPQVGELERLQREFAWIDTAVFLMEDIPELSLNDRKERISSYPKKHKRDSSKLSWLLTTWPNESLTLKEVAILELEQFDREIMSESIGNPFKSAFIELTRHANRLFRISVGRVFDETIHIQYYQHRLRLIQLIDHARLRDLSLEVANLKGQVSALQLALSEQIANGFSALNKKVESDFLQLTHDIHQTQIQADNQQRDQIVAQITSRKKLQRQARLIGRSDAERISNSSSSRRALKRSLKEAIKESHNK